MTSLDCKLPVRLSHLLFACALLSSMSLADSARALDPRPQTSKERAKHDFRDVQLGLCHPADGTRQPKSMKCSDATGKTEVSAAQKKE